MLSNDDFIQWKNDPVTKAFFYYLRKDKDEAINKLISSNTEMVGEEYGLKCALTIVQIQNIINILNIQREDINESLENLNDDQKEEL